MVSVDSKIAPIKTLEWDEKSLVSKIELREQRKRQYVAYVHAAQHGPEDYSKLVALRESFQSKGWATSSDNHHGPAVLRVTGIESADQITDLLKSSASVQGAPRESLAEVAGQSSKGAVDFIKSNSLRSSGLFYMVGDMLFMMSGIQRGKTSPRGIDWAQFATGASFAAGDAALMGFGGRDDRRQFKSLLGKLRTHLERGVDISPDSVINAEVLGKPGGILEKTYDFIHEHINKIKILAEVVGGAAYFKAGMNQENKRKMAAGAVIVSGWAAALMLNEEKRDPEKWKEAGPLEKAVMWVKEKPLRLAGGSGLIHNALSTVGHFEERAKEKAKGAAGTDHYKWDMAGIAAMLTANSLYSICTKSTGGNIKADALVNDVYGISAQILNRQPEANREAAINATVEFLGKRPEIKDTKEEIAKKLRTEIEMQSQNPWFKSIRADGTPSVAKPAASSETKKWADDKVKSVVENASHAASVEKSRADAQAHTHQI